MNDKKIENDKRNLLNELINATREVKAKFSEHKKVITDKEVEIQQLLSCWENIINFGLKYSLFQQLSSNLSNVQLFNVTSGDLFNSSSSTSSFWSFAYQFLSNDEKKRFNNFKNLWTDRGRSRALIRNAMNESCLERYLLTWINADNIFEFYDNHALLRDEKAEAILPKLASDISSLLFAIPIDDPDLNLQQSNKNVVMIEPVIESSSSGTIVKPCKPRKINLIENFDETTKKVTIVPSTFTTAASSFIPEVNLNATSSPPSTINDEFRNISERPQSPDRFSFTSTSNESKELTNNDDIISHSTTTSGDDDEEEYDDAIAVDQISVKKEENVDCVKKVDDKNEEIIKNQADRIRELEQHIKDLNLENSRLRQLLNANKVNTLSSFQVSIPRAILQKSKTKNYYVYEINLRTTDGNENWTVFKRYRDFYKLHKSLKKDHLQIKILDFPPKKKIGNTNFDFVEDRRQRLQVYIRHVIQNLPELQVDTRQLLEAKCSFFKPS